MEKHVCSESESEIAQSCLTLCDPMVCSPPGSSAHGILQARKLQWVAISFSGGPSQPRDWTRVSHIVGRRFNVWATVCSSLTQTFHTLVEPQMKPFEGAA